MSQALAPLRNPNTPACTQHPASRCHPQSAQVERQKRVAVGRRKAELQAQVAQLTAALASLQPAGGHPEDMDVRDQEMGGHGFRVGAPSPTPVHNPAGWGVRCLGCNRLLGWGWLQGSWSCRSSYSLHMVDNTKLASWGYNQWLSCLITNLVHPRGMSHAKAPSTLSHPLLAAWAPPEHNTARSHAAHHQASQP